MIFFALKNEFINFTEPAEILDMRRLIRLRSPK